MYIGLIIGMILFLGGVSDFALAEFGIPGTGGMYLYGPHARIACVFLLVVGGALMWPFFKRSFGRFRGCAIAELAVLCAGATSVYILSYTGHSRLAILAATAATLVGLVFVHAIVPRGGRQEASKRGAGAVVTKRGADINH
jgi:hypothetical protein